MATGFPQVCVAVHVASAVPDPSVTLRCPRSLGGLPHFDFWTFRRCLCHPFSFTTWLPTLFASPCLMPLLMSPVVKVPLLACAQRPRCTWPADVGGIPFCPVPSHARTDSSGWTRKALTAAPRLFGFCMGTILSLSVLSTPCPPQNAGRLRCPRSPLAGGAFWAECYTSLIIGFAHSHLPLHCCSHFITNLLFLLSPPCFRSINSLFWLIGLHFIVLTAE